MQQDHFQGVADKYRAVSADHVLDGGGSARRTSDRVRSSVCGNTIYSFASGQTPLPDELLEGVRDDVARRCGRGLSVLELPFTSDAARAILCDTKAAVRELLKVPQDYEVLFLQGGAYAQFGLLAMNLGGAGRIAAYVQSGHWSRRAAREAEPWIGVHCAAKADGCRLAMPQTWNVPSNAVYCHYTSNESADGMQFQELPRLAGVPLIADMTADFLMRPLDVAALGLVYASSQKNIGIAGLTIVIVSRALLDRCRGPVPAPFHYPSQAREQSKVNTPPIFAIAVAGHVCNWLLSRGGLSAAQERSRQKAARLYRLIATDGFYSSPVDPQFRSNVSVRFHLANQQLETEFLDGARAEGLLHLQGHPDVGGLRASLYNLVAPEAVEALGQFMEDFRRKKG